MKRSSVQSKNSKKTPLISGSLPLRAKILLHLLGAGAVVESAIYDFTTSPSVSAYHSIEYSNFVHESRAAFHNTVSYLLAKKLIASQGIKRKREFKVTDKGMGFLFKKLPDLKYAAKKWDGYFRVVIYDIPEKQNLVRDHLRSELKRLGFKFIQKSVWATPFPVENELENFLKKEGLWGKILVMKSLLAPSENQRLAKKFGYLSQNYNNVNSLDQEKKG